MDHKTVFALFALLSASFATNVNNAVWQGSDPTWHFDTDMQFTTDFTLRVIAGDVSSGDPNNLQNGDTVCTGATLRVLPTVTSRWATPDFAAVAIYPTCGGGFCPAMIPSGGVTQNRNIGWLSAATWNSQKTFGDANDYSQDPSRYNTLGPSNFANQPVTYNNVTAQFHANKEGGAAVFCKGTFEVLDGVTVKGSSAMPSVGNVDFGAGSAGAHAISSRLSGVECFGSVVKHPLNIDDNPSWFWLDFFTHNGPAIPSTLGTDTININVQNSGGTCDMHETTISSPTALGDEDMMKVKVTMHNDGDPIRVTGVTSSNAGYTAEPFPPGLCTTLGLPPSLCPPDNHFNDTINSGSDMDLYVLLERQAGASGGTTLNFQAETVSATCGGAATCNEDVPLTGPITCEVDPDSLSLGTNEVAEFGVQCFDLSADPTACVGDNWFWVGLTGGFITKSNSMAQAYTTSPPGSEGSLNYSSGLALCGSNITVTNPTYECDLLPPNANMALSQAKFFEMNGFVSGSPTDPDGASYDLIDGLSGALGNDSTDGVTYTAPGGATSGKIRGFAEFAAAPDPILGSVCFSSVQVSSGGGNNTTGGDPGNEGSTQYCTIGSGPLNVFPGYNGWVGIKCGEHANETCTNVTWSPEGGVTLGDSDDSGTGFTITAGPGSSGKIWAIINGDASKFCYAPFFVGEPECWEFT